MEKSIDEIDFEKSGCLVPVIVQDANTKDVLTLAYTNKESLELSSEAIKAIKRLFKICEDKKIISKTNKKLIEI